MKDFINKLLQKLGSFKTDKILHCFGSSLLTIFSFMFFTLLSISPYLSTGMAVLFTLFIGFCKEYFIDYKLRNTFYDNNDMIANCVGIFIGTLMNVWIIICSTVI